MLAAALPAGLVAGKTATWKVVVQNTSGAEITLFLADAAPGRVPLYYHTDHTAARPTIAAGAAELFEVTYLPDPERGIVRKIGAANAFRRRRPLLIDAANPGPAENYTFPGQLAGDFLIAWDFRNGVTNASALRTGFTQLETCGQAAEFAMRVSYRAAAAAAELIPFPASNALTRCVIQCWRGVDPSSPIIDSEQLSGIGTSASIPAVAAAEPGLSVVGICGRVTTGALNWLLPGGYDAAGANVSAGGSLVRLGMAADRIGSPAGVFTTPGATQAWGAVALILRGAGA